MPRRRGPGGEAAYEELHFPGGRAVLDGRTITVQTNTTDEQRRTMLASIMAAGPRAKESLDKTVEQLEEVLANDPLHSLAVASIIYLLKDAETYRESEDDRSPAHVEFLALKALPFVGQDASSTGATRNAVAVATTTGSGAVDSHPAASENPTLDPEVEVEDGDATTNSIHVAAQIQALETSATAIGLVREAFDLAVELIWLQFIERTQQDDVDEGFEEFRRHALMQTLTIRHSAYPEHVATILRGCLDPFEDECRQLLGFTAEEAWALTEAVHAIISIRIGDLKLGMSQQYRDEVAALARARRKKRLPPQMKELTPTEQKVILRELIEARALSDAVSIVSFTAADLAAESDLDESTALAWLNAFTCASDLYNERFHRTPCGAHPVTQRPIVATSTGYIVPAPTSLGEALRPLMEDKLRAAGRSVWGRYDHARAAWVEREATARIASVLPGSTTWTGVKWAAASDSSDVDGIVSCDDFTARIQCKAGRISPAARRGAPSMAEDIQAVINDAAQQHTRLASALDSQTATEIGFDDAQASALEAPLNVEVIVCLDDVTVWATETHKLRHLVTLPDNPQTPWVLSLADLMAVTDLLEGVELIHYITRRIRLEGEGKVEAHDELDWVGHYLKDGLYFDNIFEQENPPDSYRLLSYTEPIDEWYFAQAGLLRRTVAKPQQELPAQLRGFLGRLEQVRPRHWVLAGMLMLSGDQTARQQVVDLMIHTGKRAPAVGWSAATQVYPAHSLTIMADLRLSGAPLRRRAREYWSENVAVHGRPNAITLAIGVDAKIVIDLVQTDPARTITHDLLLRLPDPVNLTSPDAEVEA